MRKRQRHLYTGYFILFIVALVLFPSISLAFTIISEAQEVEIGRKVDEEVKKRFGLYEDPEISSYVDEIGQRLVAEAEPKSFRYRFQVLDSPEVNAFALPGGYVYVTRGLLAELNSEAELAGVIGHEIAHVSARHAAKQLTKAFGYQFLAAAIIIVSPGGPEVASGWAMITTELFNQILLGYGRENELEADELGLRYSFKAGYDPQEMVTFLRHLRLKQRLQAVEYHPFRATHPEVTERIIKADSMAGILANGKHGLRIERDSYKARLEGLLFGDKRERKRLQVYTAREGDTLKKVAQEILGDEMKAWELAIFNGVKEDTVLKEGQKLKIIPK